MLNKHKTILLLSFGICLAILFMSNTKEPPKPTPYHFELPEFVSIYFEPISEPADNPTTIEGVYLGRKLFYDKRLSEDMTMSCATCHQQSNGFSDFRQFSIGLHNEVGIRNASALINLGWEKRFFWDGRSHSLEHQILDPVTNPIEMNNTWSEIINRISADSMYPKLFTDAFGVSDIDSNTIMKALAQFERTLISFNSKFDAYYFNGISDTLTAEEERGLNLFFGRANCNHCHSDVLLTDNFFRNNGLDEHPDSGYARTTKLSGDIGKFKVPTLRNVAKTAPYMHDGRFSTLADVVDFYSSGIKSNSTNIDIHMQPLGKGLRLTDEEKKDLIAFLKTLTDYDFLGNPNFADPK